MAPRLTFNSDGRGPALSAVIAEWAGAYPKIRRVWVSNGHAEEAPRPDGGVAIALELQPVADSEETFAVWINNCEKWRLELEARIGRTVDLQWLDPDEGATTSPPGFGEPDALIYERAVER